MNTFIVLPIIFVSLVLCLASGLPLAFSLGGLATIFTSLLWGIKGLPMMVSRAYGIMGNFVLVAVPLFILMAMILGKSGITEDLYDAVYKWIGRLKGGLVIATVVVCSVVSAMTGITATSIVAMGIIALPQMLKFKYNQNLSVGCIIAAGSLGELIPPSTVMILYSATTGVSLGHLFAGGISSGLILAGLFIVYTLTRSYIQKDFCPSQPPEERVSLSEKVSSLRTVVLPVLLIILVLGSILTGAATPTEAAGVGVVGVIIVCIILRRFNYSMFKEACIETLKISGMIGWICVGSACYSSTVIALGAIKFIQGIVAVIPGGAMGALMLSLATIFLLGMFIDPIGIILICAPLFVPVMRNMGIDLLWFSMLFMVMLQVAYITPPFGYSLFYMAGVAPSHIKIRDVYKSAIPFIGLQLTGITIFIIWPESMLWLPHMIR